MSHLPAIVDAARAHATASRGERTRIVRALAEQLGCSVQTAYQRMRAAGVDSGRRRRADAGQSALSRDEALQIAALVEASRRQTGTGQLTLDDAVQILRREGRISAGTMDPATGEWLPLSISAIARAMRQYRCHPGQLAAESPATALSSPHPNWCWQIDASLSGQWYLAAGGTEQLDKTRHYAGKPGELQRIADRRLWRYVITDHCSGAIFLWYVLGAESSANAISALITCMTQRPDAAMHGVPRYLMSDGGVLGNAAMRNFLRALDIEAVRNSVGNARAKGQVECAHHIVERHFEAALKLRPAVRSLDEINRLAVRWAAHYNGTAIHSRHGMTRRDAWLRITSEQLVLAPPVAVLQALPQSVPQKCRVRDYVIRFGGQRYDVRGLPGVLQDQRVDVISNPLDAGGSVRVLITGQDGRPAHYVAPLLARDEWGFADRAAQIGTEHRAVAETPADAARKEVERIAMQADTDRAAEEARRAKRLAFGGQIDATSGWTAPVVHIPRAGTASDVQAPSVVAPVPVVPVDRPRYEARRWSFFDSVRELKRRAEERGAEWTPEHYARAQSMWPDGLTEDEFDGAVVRVLAPALRAVTGGAA